MQAILPIYKVLQIVSIFNITRWVILLAPGSQNILMLQSTSKVDLVCWFGKCDLQTVYFFFFFWSYNSNIIGEGKVFRLMNFYILALLEEANIDNLQTNRLLNLKYGFSLFTAFPQ